MIDSTCLNKLPHALSSMVSTMEFKAKLQLLTEYVLENSHPGNTGDEAWVAYTAAPAEYSAVVAYVYAKGLKPDAKDPEAEKLVAALVAAMTAAELINPDASEDASGFQPASVDAVVEMFLDLHHMTGEERSYVSTIMKGLTTLIDDVTDRNNAQLHTHIEHDDQLLSAAMNIGKRSYMQACDIASLTREMDRTTAEIAATTESVKAELATVGGGGGGGGGGDDWGVVETVAAVAVVAAAAWYGYDHFYGEGESATTFTVE